MAEHGFTVAVYNRTVSRVDDFHGSIAEDTLRARVVPAHSLDELVASLKDSPKRVMLMVKAGPPVDEFIDLLVPLLQTGDIIIDGGNSHFADTDRRCKQLARHGMHYVGCGVSGGEEGARRGPSLMPGGSEAAWPHLCGILQSIAARSQFLASAPCCAWLGAGGAGHFVKMVHNGIEYGDMQLIGEAYHIMRDGLGMSAMEQAGVFDAWNSAELQSFLIEATRDILRVAVDPKALKRVDNGGVSLVDLIKDVTGQKGTGKWTAVSALDLGVPVTLISEAVQTRILSSLRSERLAVAQAYPNKSSSRTELSLDDLRAAVFASKIISYAQGFMMLREASAAFDWRLNFAAVAVLWSGGCIIRSSFLRDIHAAYQRDPALASLLLDPFFQQALQASEPGWRRTVAAFVSAGLPCPALGSALSFFDGYRCARLPANLLQAQRDYFGAHQFELADGPEGQAVHFDWIGSGGAAVSSNYQA